MDYTLAQIDGFARAMERDELRRARNHLVLMATATQGDNAAIKAMLQALNAPD
jgi:hypothetical protein